jgi:insulysin
MSTFSALPSSLLRNRLFQPFRRPTYLSTRYPLAVVAVFQSSAFGYSQTSKRSLGTMAPSVPSDVRPDVQILSSNIEKPELDDRSYRLIRLGANKLEALLVHDPKTEKASAALDVHVGHMSDPKDFPGLAHALEHCLFLGNLPRCRTKLNSLQVPRNTPRKMTTRNICLNTAAYPTHSRVNPLAS